MREISLATGVKNKHILDYLHTNLKTKLDFCKTIITNYTDSNFSYLLFAFDEQFANACESIIKENIIDYIELVYKIDFLKTKIHNRLCDDLTYNAYVKVLSLFDRSTDVDALDKIIIFNETFFVDSFLEFRLLPLKKHWSNLAELSSDNMTMLSSSTFVDVIKFLINTMDSLVYKVKVICNGENFTIYNMKNKNAHIRKIAECNNTMDLITQIFNSCPSYIDVYLSETDNTEAVSFLSSVFANRLKIYSKNG